MKNIMNRLGLPEDQPIENKIISRSIESAQGKIEGHNFDIRKRVLEYDDVMNKQRETVYKKRKEALKRKSIKDQILQMFVSEAESLVAVHTAMEDEDGWNVKEISQEMATMINFDSDQGAELEKHLAEIQKSKDFSQGAEKKNSMIEFLIDEMKKAYAAKEKEFGPEQMRMIEKSLLLRTVDSFWMDHLEQIEYMRDGIGLQGYGQRDPLIVYKKEAFNMFQDLLANISRTMVNAVFKVQMVSASMAEMAMAGNVSYSGGEEPQQFGDSSSDADASGSREGGKKEPAKPIVNSGQIVGRNDPCPCGAKKPDGSSIKYKHCHGRNA